MMGRLYDATYGRLFAAGYDWLLGEPERAGLAELRRDLAACAAGATVEVGAGTGLNLRYYPDRVTELVLTEPSPHMARRLRARRAELGRPAAVVEAPAERLPFAAASFDTAVATLVLCTVPDVAAALSEVRRVLRPDGRLLLLEHVRSTDLRLARWQDRWERPWRALTAGCRCNRDIAGTVGTAGFTLERIISGAMPKAPPIVRPLITAVARPVPGPAGSHGLVDAIALRSALTSAIGGEARVGCGRRGHERQADRDRGRDVYGGRRGESASRAIGGASSRRRAKKIGSVRRAHRSSSFALSRVDDGCRS